MRRAFPEFNGNRTSHVCTESFAHFISQNKWQHLPGSSSLTLERIQVSAQYGLVFYFSYTVVDALYFCIHQKLEYLVGDSVTFRQICIKNYL